MIIPNENLTMEAVKVLCEVLRSDEFKLNVTRMGGYDTRDIGKIMYERG